MRWLNDVLSDSAYAARTFRKQPGFAAVAVLSAGLGIGACSLVFGIANVALVRPLPVDNPSRLASLTGKQVKRGRSGMSMAYPDFEDLSQARSFQGLTAFFQFLPAVISSGGEPQRYWGSLVTANYFDVVRPVFAVGHGFDKNEAAPAVVLSHPLWQSRFGSDRTIVGRSIELNSRKVTVVGVTAPGFRGTEVMFFSDFWVPFSMLSSFAEGGLRGDRLHDRSGQWLMAAGRLRDGVSWQAAAAEIDVIGKRLQSAYPATNEDRGFHLERAGQINAGFRQRIVVFFTMLLGVAGLVLFTACANVANLLLARASSRRQEIATRLAMGAGRGRLVRQLLTESVLLAWLGGAAGYGVALLGAYAISRSRIPLPLPVDFSISLDYRVMLFCVALSALTGVVFGLVPAWRATRPELVGALKDEPFGLRNLLVVAQVTTCMVLLVCSGLFLRSFNAARNIDIGFSHRNLLLLAFDPSLNRYGQSQTRRIMDEMLEKTRAISGVESVTLTSSVPLSMEGTQNSFAPEEDPKNAISAHIYSIATGYFETFGIRRLDGQDFRPGGSAEEVAIVNQALADKAFPKQNAVGRRILYFGKSIRITGLVANTKSRSIGEDPHPCLYLPIAKDLRGNDSLTGITLVVRTRGNPAGYVAVVRQAIRDIDPALALFDVRTMDTHLYRAMFVPRASAFLFGLAGLMGLLIATVGIYGVISFAVARQTKEIGIRMALGAKRGQVLGMVLTHGLALTGIGAGIGLGVALALSRIVASLLYGVSPTDTLTFIAVPALLVILALVACLIPARRAASLDPIRALRYE